MELAELLDRLFPAGHAVEAVDGLITGGASFPTGVTGTVVGVAGGATIGTELALRLAQRILAVVARGDASPILLLIDSGSQRMGRREELLGLNEYLAHLAKTLLLADRLGHDTLAILYGGSAAGAFISTALAANRLVALPGSTPEVMDLRSMARVTKLPLERLTALAKDTVVFAPGCANLLKVGAIRHLLDVQTPLDRQLRHWLTQRLEGDARDRLGAERGGRPRAKVVSDRIVATASSDE